MSSDAASGPRAQSSGDSVTQQPSRFPSWLGPVALLLVSMFFLGISLVFKSKAKWGLLGAGGVVLAASLALMATLESAGTGLPSGSAAAVPTDKAGDEKAEAKPGEAPAPVPGPAPAPPAR